MFLPCLKYFHLTSAAPESAIQCSGADDRSPDSVDAAVFRVGHFPASTVRKIPCISSRHHCRHPTESRGAKLILSRTFDFHLSAFIPGPDNGVMFSFKHLFRVRLCTPEETGRRKEASLSDSTPGGADPLFRAGGVSNHHSLNTIFAMMHSYDIK